jgi:hypothetical protein
MGNPVPKVSIPRRQILIIGMLDSVHLARWLGQFVNEEIDFVIFASKKYRKIHPLTISLLNSNYVANYKLAHWPFLPFISGYLDFFSFDAISLLVSVILKFIDSDYFTAFFLFAIATPRPFRVLALV